MMDLDLTELPEKILSCPSENVMFKILLYEVPLLWAWIVSYVLGKPTQEIKKQHTDQQIELLPKYSAKDKLSVTDSINKFNDIDITLEMQGYPKPDFRQRILAYWGKIISFGHKKGQDYTQIPKRMVIAILNYVLYGKGGFLYKVIPNLIHTDPEDVEFYGINCIQLPLLQINWENPSQYELIFAFLGAEYWAQVKKILSIYNKLYADKPGGNLMAELVQTLVTFTVDPELVKVHRELKKQEKIMDYERMLKEQKAKNEAEREADRAKYEAIIARYKAKFGAIPTD
jgi:hypothetical protein